MDWGESDLYAIPTSLYVLGGSKNVAHRERIIDECISATMKPKTVLIKWQLEDTVSNRMLPATEQSIIWLQAANLVTLRERLTQKPWWRDDAMRQEQFIRKESQVVEAAVESAEKTLRCKALRVVSADDARYWITQVAKG